ncbi:hypothetical protein CASFOL_041261 [Castilleja foliolosa]|uniref:AT-hook motif nuclear-localized protein n=1 Tax=Castilleja foliolosa TaxID=1961234 RepID=A0ABD3BDZ8_9LAMI
MDTTAKPVSPQLQITVFTPGASSSSYHVGPRPEHFEPGTFPTASVLMNDDSSKKKRGRPRKYKPEGSSSTVFSAMPISSSVPPGIGKSYVEVKTPSLERPINSERKYRNKVGAEKLDEFDDCLTGSSFLPHVITVNTGEDISTKIMEFSQRGPRSVCVICGNGMVSNVTIRHPSSSREALVPTSGLFEILSFTGSFNPVEIPDPRFGRCGTMTISLAGADGRVVGGFIGGLTIAASPIKVIVASFLLESPLVLKTKKPKTDTPYSVDGSSPGGAHTLNLEKRISFNNTRSENPTTTTNWDNATQIAGTSRKVAADINISLQG